MRGRAMQDFPGCKALSSVTAAADTIMHADRISTSTKTKQSRLYFLQILVLYV